MSMSLATLEILEQAQFPPGQARAIAKAMEIDSAARREELATKADLAVVRRDIDELRHTLEARIDDRFGKLELRMETQKAERVRWVFTVIIGQMAVTLGFTYFMLQYLR